MNKIALFGTVFLLAVIYGCVSGPITFKQGVEKISEFDKKADAGMKTPPNSIEGINELHAQLTGFGAANPNMPKSLKQLLDFRIKTLEAEKIHNQGWQWGEGSTTDYGFGCKKGYAKIRASARLRNISAQKGYDAVNALQLFVDEFPNEALSLNLTQKDVVFLNAAYYSIENKARRDDGIVKSLCKDSIEEFNLTDIDISGLLPRGISKT